MKIDIARAWKDENYRQSLSNEERATLPANPVGELELTDHDLSEVYGGRRRHGNNNGGGSYNCGNISVSGDCGNTAGGNATCFSIDANTCINSAAICNNSNGVGQNCNSFIGSCNNITFSSNTGRGSGC